MSGEQKNTQTNELDELRNFGDDDAGLAILAALAPAAEAVGIDLERKDDRVKLPTFFRGMDIVFLAHEVGMILRNRGLYLFGDHVVTMQPDGTKELMTEKRFVSFAQKSMLFWSEKERKDDGEIKYKYCNLPIATAGLILVADDFRACLPVVNKIYPARLPVWKNDEKKEVELLPVGYDIKRKVFVTADAPAITEIPFEEAVEWLRWLHRGFPWPKDDGGRSFAAHIAALVGLFVQTLFPEKQTIPMFYYNANLPGSGKSILAAMVCCSVYGHAQSKDFSTTDEFTKTLSTTALEGAGFIFFDDIDGYVKSQALNRWLTSPEWAERRMHSQENFVRSKRCLTLMTGNNATLSDDLVRRSVVVDLFSEYNNEDRMEMREKANEGGEEYVEISLEWLNRRENRSRILSCLFAMVRHWQEVGCPRGKTTMPSFEAFSQLVGGIVLSCGFGDGFKKARLLDGGDKYTTEMDVLLQEVVRELVGKLRGAAWPQQGMEISLGEIARVARLNGIMVEKIGDKAEAIQHYEENPRLQTHYENPATDGLTVEQRRARFEKDALEYLIAKSQGTSLGRRLKQKAGMNIRFEGHFYQFGERNNSKSNYRIYKAGATAMHVEEVPAMPLDADDVDCPF